MKHICILTSEGNKGKGGISRVNKYLCDEIRHGEYYYEIENMTTTNGIPFPFWIFYFIYSAVRYFVMAFRGKVALLHVHFSSHRDTYSSLVFFYISVLFYIPVVLHHHGSEFDSFYRGLGLRRKNLVKKMLCVSKRLIILGEVWRDFFVEEVGVDSRKIEVLPNAIPDKNIDRKSLSKDCLKFLFLGKVCEEKGLTTLLTAFSKLTQYNWSLTIGGSGKIKEYKELVRKFGISDKVKFTGWIDEGEVEEALQMSDVFVLASQQEIHPVSVLEAMSHKLAIVVTPVGVIPEFAVHEENCILVSVNDAEELATALRELIERPLHVRKLGDAAHKTFMEKFEITDYKKRLLEIYDDVLGFI